MEEYHLYLKARHATATLDDWAGAHRYLQQAIALDPSYALAYLGLADYYVWAVDWEVPAREALVELAEAAEERSWYVMTWKVDPDLDPPRGDPRFKTLLRKVGLGP